MTQDVTSPFSSTVACVLLLPQAKGVKSSFEGKGLCTEANLKKNAGVKTKVPLKDSTESVATLRYKK